MNETRLELCRWPEQFDPYPHWPMVFGLIVLGADVMPSVA